MLISVVNMRKSMIILYLEHYSFIYYLGKDVWLQLLQCDRKWQHVIPIWGLIGTVQYSGDR